MGDQLVYTQPNGRKVNVCSCMNESLPWITKWLIRKGIIKQQLDFTQGAYNRSVAASARTHWGGGVGDILPIGDAGDTALEEVGVISYQRDSRDGMSPHHHILWNGCPHMHAQAAAQVVDWKQMRNGLANDGPDRDRSRPNPIRTWQQGVAWIKTQLNEGDDEMLAEEKAMLKAIHEAVNGRPGIERAGESAARQTLQFPVWRGGKPVTFIQEVADIKTLVLALQTQVSGLTAVCQALATSQGLDMPAVTELIEKAFSDAVERFRLVAEIRFDDTETPAG